MTDSITFRTTDNTRWGPGQNSNLSKTQIDINFWVLLSQVNSLADHIAMAAVGLHDFYVDGSQFFVVLTDGTQLGPYDLPQVTWHWTNPPSGAWVPLSGYNLFDVFSFTNTIYQVIFAHTSATTFDPNANDGAGHDYYQVLFTLPAVASNNITGATFSPTLPLANTYMRLTNPGGCIVSIPPESDVAWPDNTEMHFHDASESGSVTIEPLSPVIINPVIGFTFTIGAIGGTVGIKKVGTDEWDIFGLLAPSSP